MSSYVDRHAALYDLFYADKPYAGEAAFVTSLLREQGVGAGARVLELACGTGRHAIELARSGYRVVATDYSPHMLACAASRAAGTQVELLEQDMRKLSVPGPPFDAAVSFFDAIGYVATNEGLADVLAGLRRQLRVGGLFVFEFWHAAAMLRSYEPVRVRRFAVPEGEVLRISETRLDVAKQLASVTYTILELSRAGTFSRLEETQTNRYFLVREVAAWLTAGGFEPLQFFAGFDRERPIDHETWHVVAMARKTAS